MSDVLANRMEFRAPAPDLDKVKEIKVKVPVLFHIRLHSIRVLHGKPIGEAVTEALEQYFAKLEAVPR